MRVAKTFVVSLVAACSVAFAGQASAALFRVDVSGVIGSVTNTTGQPDGFGGSSFFYSFIVDDAAAPSVTNPGSALYLSSVRQFFGAIGSYAFGGTTGGVIINDNIARLSGQPADALLIRHGNALVNASIAPGRDDFAFTSGDLAGLPLLLVGFDALTTDTNFIDPAGFTGSLLDALAADPLSFGLLVFRATFDADNIATNGPRIQAAGAISQIEVTRLPAVPLPPAVGFFALGLAAIGWGQRVAARKSR